MTLRRHLALAAAGIAASTAAYGYWHAATHATLNVNLAYKTNTGVINQMRNGQVEFLDDSGGVLARATIDARYSATFAIDTKGCGYPNSRTYCGTMPMRAVSSLFSAISSVTVRANSCGVEPTPSRPCSSRSRRRRRKSQINLPTDNIGRHRRDGGVRHVRHPDLRRIRNHHAYGFRRVAIGRFRHGLRRSACGPQQSKRTCDATRFVIRGHDISSQALIE